jgi:uncharacterized protein YbjT (DUF2867 family)
MAGSTNMKVRAIITGATGMVGEGVLRECLEHGSVERVLVIGRRTCGTEHPKLREIVHADFHDISVIENQLGGYNACFFCLGASSVGMGEDEYRALTYTLTMHLAGTLSKINPSMTFCYVSGLGTDSTEKGKFSWARIKGKTENDLMKLPFRRVYAFRPGFMLPTKGLKHAHGYYKVLTPLYPFARLVFPNYVSTLKELGLAMISSVLFGYERQVLEVADIVALSKK